MSVRTRVELDRLGSVTSEKIKKWRWAVAVAAGTRDRLQSPRATVYGLFTPCLPLLRGATGHRLLSCGACDSPWRWSAVLYCCWIIRPGPRGQGYDTNEGSCRMWSAVRASMDGSEGARLRASFVLAGHPPMSASIVLVRPGPAGFAVSLSYFCTTFFFLKVRNVSYANQVLGVKRVNQRAVEGTKRDGMVVLKVDSPCKVSF